MKISFKLTLIMVVLGLFSIGSVGVVLIARARSNIVNLTDKYTLSLTEKSAKEIERYLDGYWSVAETVAKMMEQYDTIIPETDGWHTFERIRGISNLHNVPIAIFTASNDPKDVEHARRIGAVDYIRKPTTQNELLGRMRNVLSGRRREDKSHSSLLSHFMPAAHGKNGADNRETLVS